MKQKDLIDQEVVRTLTFQKKKKQKRKKKKDFWVKKVNIPEKK